MSLTHEQRTCTARAEKSTNHRRTVANSEPLYESKQSFVFRCSRCRRVVVCLSKFNCVYVNLKKSSLARDTLKTRGFIPLITWNINITRPKKSAIIKVNKCFSRISGEYHPWLRETACTTAWEALKKTITKLCRLQTSCKTFPYSILFFNLRTD